MTTSSLPLYILIILLSIIIGLWEVWTQNDMLKLSKNKQTSYKIAR